MQMSGNLIFTPSISQNPANYHTKQLELYNIPLDFTTINPDSIQKYVAMYCETAKDTYDYIAQVKNISFATVIQPLINFSIARQNVGAMITIPLHVHPDAATRDESNKAEEEIKKFEIEQDMREDAYAVIKQYYDTTFKIEQPNLSHEECLYVENTMRDYRRRGMTLPTPELRQEVKEIQQRLAELNTQFQQNLNEDKTSFEYTRAELDGLPEDWFTEKRKLRDDVYKVTLKNPDFLPIVDYCHNRTVREKMFLAFNSRCKDTNTQIATETVQLRKRLTAMLGYDSAVDFTTEIKMAKNAATVGKFLDEMNARFLPIQQRTLLEMRDFAREYTKDPNFELHHHDMRYFVKLREKSLCNIDHKRIQEYFPRQHVVNATLDIYQSMLKLKFVAIDTSNKWHDDTQWYQVFDATTKELLGKFILDLTPREGKYSHAAVADLILGCDSSKLTGNSEETQTHLATMLCNFPENAPIPFDQVVTFFHEFGHVMHIVCSKVDLPEHNGCKIEQDFVEAPSQMLENWCYQESVLNLLSEHKNFKNKIPAEMVAKIKQSELLHTGFFSKRQLSFATFDFKIHTLSEAELVNFDINAFWNKLNTEVTLLPYSGDAFPASFSHLFGNDYYGGYYGYMYSKVVALCMFDEKFLADPLSVEAGTQYRKCILEPGATKGAMDLVRNFLGHEPTIDAFLRDNGMEAPMQVTQQFKVAKISGP